MSTIKKYRMIELLSKSLQCHGAGLTNRGVIKDLIPVNGSRSGANTS